MKTKEQIDKEVEALKAVRPNVIPMSMFGDDNLAAIDAQIMVLEDDMSDGDIYDKYDHTGSPEYIVESAFATREWMDDEEDEGCEGLACEWPLRKENTDDSN